MSECFKDIIGIRSACNSTASSSGLFIEDIGITAKECDSFINADFKSGLDLIKSKMDFAIRIIRSTIANEFSTRINTSSFLESRKLGEYQDSLQMKPGSTGNYGGVSLTLNNSQAYYNAFVSYISLQVDVTQDVDVKVFDLITGLLVDTITIPCVQNKIVEKTVNKIYSSYKQKMDLIFVYDTTGINSNTTILATGCSHCQGYRYNGYYVSAAPIYLDKNATKIRSSLIGGTHTFGLSVNYSIQCSLDNWLCDMANLMAFPILYKTGELIMEYATTTSKRQNSDVNVDAERNERRLAAYSNEYNKQLGASIKKIRLPKNDRCFTCNSYSESKIILP